MKQKIVLAALLIAMAIALVAQNFKGNLSSPALTDQQRIERLEKQVSSLQDRLASLERRTGPRVTTLESPQ
jgi:hypothetical protein